MPNRRDLGAEVREQHPGYSLGFKNDAHPTDWSAEDFISVMLRMKVTDYVETRALSAS